MEQLPLQYTARYKPSVWKMGNLGASPNSGGMIPISPVEMLLSLQKLKRFTYLIDQTELPSILHTFF